MEAFDTPITRALPEHNLDELLQVTYPSMVRKELHRRNKAEVPPLACAATTPGRLAYFVQRWRMRARGLSVRLRSRAVTYCYYSL